MLNSKQRAKLRSMANTMDAIFQVGKNSITPAIIKELNDVLEARELIKIKVLQNCETPTREVADIVSLRTESEVAQVIGSCIVLYKQNKNPKKRVIILDEQSKQIDTK